MTHGAIFYVLFALNVLARFSLQDLRCASMVGHQLFMWLIVRQRDIHVSVQDCDVLEVDKEQARTLLDCFVSTSGHTHIYGKPCLCKYDTCSEFGFTYIYEADWAEPRHCYFVVVRCLFCSNLSMVKY